MQQQQQIDSVRHSGGDLHTLYAIHNAHYGAQYTHYTEVPPVSLERLHSAEHHRNQLVNCSTEALQKRPQRYRSLCPAPRTVPTRATTAAGIQHCAAEHSGLLHTLAAAAQHSGINSHKDIKDLLGSNDRSALLAYTSFCGCYLCHSGREGRFLSHTQSPHSPSTSSVQCLPQYSLSDSNLNHIHSEALLPSQSNTSRKRYYNG